MSAEPKIEQRAEQPYVAIKASVTMLEIGKVVPPLTGEVIGWLGARQVEPAGAPFFKYNVIDMERTLEIEAGWPVATAVAGDERVLAGVLPAGRYVTMTHVGHPDGLYEATGRLLTWAKEQGLSWDSSGTEAGERWGARLEIYESDPDDEPDMDKWVTVLAFRLAD